jgi:hypothetical protein
MAAIQLRMELHATVLLSSGTFSTAAHFSHTLPVNCALSESTAPPPATATTDLS